MNLLSAQELEEAIRASRVSPAARDRLLAHYRPFLRIIAEQSIGPALRRREDASDIVQRTMVEAAAAADRFEGQSEPEFTAWIRQILRHNIANAVRDNRAACRDVRREQHEGVGESSATISWQLPAALQTSPSMRLIKADAALNLARALDGLPEDQRSAVSMRHLEGRSLAEIAEMMDKTPTAVAGLIRRGVTRLRADLADDKLL